MKTVSGPMNFLQLKLGSFWVAKAPETGIRREMF